MPNNNRSFKLIPLSERLVSKSFPQRVAWIRGIFLLIVFIILLRALYLQVIERPTLDFHANRQWNQVVSVKLQRGTIFDAEGNILAVSLPLESIFAVPEEVETPEHATRQLAPILGIDTDQLLKKLTAKVSFTWLLRNPKPEISQRIKDLEIKGIHFVTEYQRFYPYGDHASQLIGFSGIDSQGLEGVEFRFNSHLMGNTPTATSWKNLYQDPDIKAVSGGSLTLTLRSKLQYYTEKELGIAIRAMDALQGTAIIMESQTGNILAMANLPDYDPNNFGSFDNTTYFNRAVSATYEPGSTFKVITVASALESGTIQQDAVLFCENGEYQIQDRVIHDVAKYGWLSLEKIIQKSSNICAAKIGQQMPKPIFHQMIRNFGFGSKTGIDLPGEVEGKVHNYENWMETDTATISYGHTISVTPIQIISAINAIATGGVLLTPNIVQESQSATGEIHVPDLVQGKRILKQETADLVKHYMTTVTQKGGTGYSARIEGISVAGKTGTSRKFDKKKQQYSSKNHVASFVGFFPAANPQLTILVMIDEPHKPYLNSKGPAPIFKKIAQHAIRLYPGSGPESSPHEAGGAGSPSIFSAMAVNPDPVGETPLSPEQLARQLKNKTMKEILQIANRENMDLTVSGSGTVDRVIINDIKSRRYTVRLH